MKLEKIKTLIHTFYKQGTTLIKSEKVIPRKESYRPIFHIIVDKKKNKKKQISKLNLPKKKKNAGFITLKQVAWHLKINH